MSDYQHRAGFGKGAEVLKGADAMSITQERRKELRYLAEYMKACGDAWEPDACLIGNMKAAKVALVGAAVPALLDALDEAESDIAELRALDAEAQIGADEQTKQLAALRSRCEKLEAVREAAEKVIHDEIHGSISREIWAAFKAALSAAAIRDAK